VRETQQGRLTICKVEKKTKKLKSLQGK